MSLKPGHLTLKLFNHRRLFTGSIFYVGYGYLLWSVILLLIAASTGNFSQRFIDTYSLWVHDLNHTHSLASFQWSGLFDQQTLHLTENCLQIQKWCPYTTRGEEWFLHSFVIKTVRNNPASANQGCSTSSTGSCHVHGMSWPCLPNSPYPTSFASAKLIFKMDCANW